MDITFIAGQPENDEWDVISSGMVAHHASHGHDRKDTFFSFILKNDKKEVVGSIVGAARWGWAAIRTLWIHDSLRGKGWGRKLMEEFEKEAIRLGCKYAYTDTYTWQAPEFYRKLGYEEYARLDDFPEGSALYYFKKKLK